MPFIGIYQQGFFLPQLHKGKKRRGFITMLTSFLIFAQILLFLDLLLEQSGISSCLSVNGINLNMLRGIWHSKLFVHQEEKNMFLPNSGHYGRTWEFSICTEINHLNTFCPLLPTRLLLSLEKNTSEPQPSLKILYILLYYYLKDPRHNFSCLASVQDQFLNSSFLLYPLRHFC